MNRSRILGTDITTDRVRGVPLSHPACRGLVAAGVRSLGLDWRTPGSIWGEGVSPTILLFWVASGQVRLVDGPECGPGCCLVLPPACPKRLTAPQGPLHAAYVHVMPGGPWTALADRVAVLPAQRASLLAQLVAGLAEETLGGPTQLARALAATALAACTELAARGGAATLQGRQRLQTIWDEVAAAPHQPWSIAGLARRAGLSEGHLHRRVVALWGATPMAMVRRIRLECAADLLRTSAISVADAAQRVGYTTPFALSNAMHRELGTRPRDLR